MSAARVCLDADCAQVPEADVSMVCFTGRPSERCAQAVMATSANPIGGVVFERRSLGAIHAHS